VVGGEFLRPDTTFTGFNALFGLVWENGAGVFLPFFKNASVNFGDGESESNTSFTTISGLFGRFDFRIFTLTGLDPNQPYEYEFRLL
jgi:hypothetical protein